MGAEKGHIYIYNWYMMIHDSGAVLILTYLDSIWDYDRWSGEVRTFLHDASFNTRFQQLGHCTDRTAILPRFQTSSGVSLDWNFVGTALMALMSLQLDWWRIWEEFIAVYLRWEVKPVHLQNCWISQHLERVRREKDGVCGAMVTWPPPVAGNGDRTSIFRI